MATVCETNLSCAVCLELYDDPRILPCGHSYCLKCLIGLTKKMQNKRLIICPICQAESKFKYGVHEFYTKNYELKRLVQSLILEKNKMETPCEGSLCEICDPETPAERACVECEKMHCEECFNTYHPMRGGILSAHTIVNTDETFKSKTDLKNDDRNMYCSDCDALITVMVISKHKNHDVLSLKEAHSLFKDKLDEATGNIDLMQSTLDDCLEKSKDKLNEVASIFQAIELALTRRKEEVLNKLSADVKEALSAINNLAPAMSIYRELQERTDTTSFIEECQSTLRRSSLKSDFNEVHMMFEKINTLKCANESVINEITNLELSNVPELDGPKITKISHVIKGRKMNKVVLKWTTIPDAESYRIFSKVKASTSPVTVVSTIEASCVLDNIDGTETTELWVTAMVNGRESLSSASVKVPSVTLPNLLFDHKRAGKAVRVSRDGRKSTCVNPFDKQLVGDHYPQAENALGNDNTVLGDFRMMDGCLYWEVEAVHLGDRWDPPTSIFGVTSSVSHEYDCPGRDAASWAANLKYQTTATIRMMHANHCLHKAVCGSVGRSTHSYGLLLNIDNRWLSVIDVKERNSLYTFTNLDTSRGVWPIFAVYGLSTLRLLSPDEIQHAPLLLISKVEV